MISGSSSSLSAYHDISRLSELKFKAGGNGNESLLEVAKQFESIFINMMLSSARNAITDGGIFQGPALKTYQQMFDQQVAVDMAGAGGIGLAEVIVRQLQYAGANAAGADGQPVDASP